MNAHAKAHAAYMTPNMAYKTPRSAEYDVISRITARLRSAINAQPFVFADLAAAMQENRVLWMELATDLASSGNALPTQLRAQLLGLAQFSLRHTEAVLAGRDSAEVLVDINLAILRGLSGKAGTE